MGKEGERLLKVNKENYFQRLNLFTTTGWKGSIDQIIKCFKRYAKKFEIFPLLFDDFESGE